MLAAAAAGKPAAPAKAPAVDPYGSIADLKVAKPEDEDRARAMGIKDFKKIYKSEDLACGKDIVFAATGVTDGSLMKGIQFFGAGIRTSSIVMQTNPHRVRFIDSIQVYPGPSVKIRF